MKKLLLFFLGLILLLAIILFSAIMIMDEKLPEGSNQTEADVMADRIFDSLNKEAYDTLDYIKWSFPRGHRFEWFKQKDSVIVTWAENRVQLLTRTQEGIAFQNNIEVQGQTKEQLIQKAWALFANDSFWLVAPYKIKDPGTSRAIVNTEEGKALMVTYSSGGVTPGDSYLWFTDEEGRPNKWKMWVSIIPVGGLEFSWENWQEKEGAWFAPIHKGPMGVSVDLEIIEIR